eukprot:4078189-Amphidinium_carterae.1
MSASSLYIVFVLSVVCMRLYDAVQTRHACCRQQAAVVGGTQTLPRNGLSAIAVRQHLTASVPGLG